MNSIFLTEEEKDWLCLSWNPNNEEVYESINSLLLDRYNTWKEDQRKYWFKDIQVRMWWKIESNIWYYTNFNY